MTAAGLRSGLLFYGFHWAYYKDTGTVGGRVVALARWLSGSSRRRLAFYRCFYSTHRATVPKTSPMVK
jgi:hypothetical protein